ncbi:hypothetical protein XBJ2_1960001 [Xenorhabdus bovienii str. Jollieti]|uniref:Uncharacterized protein n=1 Tax=Xenorhabdus bovienii (strain SS-2004) TaxID=406818 RepID=D3V5V8_XENBS|nr:hypothetical protein XBJ1_3919 [Xenorhabdus bovienii SS-2004]CDH28781.1 hypothetical protein XBJ2_1960001 [Xenorhabdus bovienii str. Jollieti]
MIINDKTWIRIISAISKKGGQLL